MSHPILLYDGVCGLCNRFVQFILRRDPKGIFRFASLQSVLASQILQSHGLTATGLDTMYVVVNPGEASESLLARSDGVSFVLRQLGGIWPVCAFFWKVFPRPFRDFFYDIVARIRYRLFGRYDTCPLPATETRARFLDQ
jgi:predicted DCC family thiol-disulfide oxidoreductase YuxK